MRQALWVPSVVLTVALSASPARAESDPDAEYLPPDASGICPSIRDDYVFCSQDPWSENCPGFVAAAQRLAEVYREEVRKHPGSRTSLLSAIWWGCGSADLIQIKALLRRIELPEARKLLGEEPFRSVADERVPER